ncbi:MAG: EAL domain-containing protein [Acidimicrobiales bacterium]|nr:EAL domain-containing protein [Acidimicrobiales bacterium]
MRSRLPEGRSLPADVFAQRHRGILFLLWLHVPALFTVALVRGEPVVRGAAEAGVVAGIAGLATVARPYRNFSMSFTSIGLLTCSAELVHLTGGLTEMHFHYFVMVSVVTLYQAWWPFLLAIGYVFFQHGVTGVIAPSAVYNHSAAIDSPVRWAVVHTGFVLAMSVVGIVSWRLNELLLDAAREREDQLAEAQALAKVGSWEWRAGAGTSWSREMYGLLGVDEKFLAATDGEVASLVHPDDRPSWRVDVGAMSVVGGVHDLDFRMVRPDGEVRWFHGRGRATAWDGDKVTVMAGTLQDITERKQSEEALRASDQERRGALSRLEATLESTADGLVVVDLDERISDWNRRFRSMWGVPDDLLARGDARVVLGHMLDQLVEPAGFAASVEEPAAKDGSASPETLVFDDGRVFEAVSRPQTVDGRVVGRVWSFRDVTDRTRLQEELAHLAFHDPLTGLANKALFRDRLNHAIDRRRTSAGELAVLFVDLDKFKDVNDSLGHAAGDELLVEVTGRIVATLRAADTAARQGGDEFAILLEDLNDSDEAEQVAARVRSAVRRPFRLAGKDVFTTASIGIATDAPGATADHLLRNADLAMYEAKRLGRDRSERFAPSMHAEVLDRIDLEADLRRALVRDELRLEYQPIVYLDTGKIAAAEALVRWEHPERGLLTPNAFIPFAEESGMIDEIGRWVLEQACIQTCRWHEAGTRHPPIGVTVNLSPRQLRDEHLVATIDATLSSSGLDPSMLMLEITETAMMHDTEVVLTHLHELEVLGVRLALDDFGTGYSSLEYLQRFPIDVIKVDRTFVDRTDRGVEEAALARAIIRLAQSLRLATVAEGVENATQVEWLRAARCNGAQGFHIARPGPAEAVTELLGQSGPLLPPAASASEV